MGLVMAGAAAGLLCGCVPATEKTTLAHELLVAARSDAGLAVGPRWCDDCSVSVTDARRSGVEPSLAAAVVHVSYNDAGDQGQTVIFNERQGRWHVLSGNARACERLARVDRVPIRVLRRLGVCLRG